MTKFLISGEEWEAIRWKYPSGLSPEEAGYLLYWSAERVELLMRLRERWNTRR